MDYNKLPAYQEGCRIIRTAKILKILCIVWIVLGSLAALLLFLELCETEWYFKDFKIWVILACLFTAIIRMLIASYLFSLIRKEGRLIQDFSVLKYEHEKLLASVGGLESLEKAEREADIPGTWRCVCGRRNQAYISTCSCGVNKREIIRE